MTRALGILAAVTMVVPVGICLAQAQPAADLIVTNGHVWTGSVEHPEAEAIAVVGERIVAVGTSDEIGAWRGPATRVIDGRGHRVVPGFNDSHVHFIWGGQQLDNVDLRDAPSPEEFARRIERHAAKLPANEWVVGGSWDDQRTSPGRLPTKELIDPVTTKTPVFVVRYDGHMGLANSLALRMAGITAGTSDPAGGLIVRGDNGEPTGILKDAAMELVRRAIPPLTPQQRERYARRALAHAASLGVTSVQYMNCTAAEFRTLAQLAESGELTTRVYAAPMETGWQDQAKLGIRRAFGSASLRLGALKGYADGSLGSSTAYFFDPYTDDPSNRGLLSDEMQPPGGMLERMIGADAAGLQLCIHGIGDRAISEVLDLFEQVQTANGPRDRRFRIEHSQHVAPKDFARYRARRDRVGAAVPRDRRRPLGRWADRAVARTNDVRLSHVPRRRRAPGAGHRLARGPAQSAGDDLRGGDARHVGWAAQRGLGARAENHSGRSHARIHAGLGVRGVPGGAEGVARGGQVGRHRDSGRRHLFDRAARDS